MARTTAKSRTRHAFTRFRNKTQCTPGCTPWPTLNIRHSRFPGIYPCNRKAASSAGQARLLKCLYLEFCSSSTAAATKSRGAITTQGRKDFSDSRTRKNPRHAFSARKEEKLVAVNLRRYGLFSHLADHLVIKTEIQTQTDADKTERARTLKNKQRDRTTPSLKRSLDSAHSAEWNDCS